MYASLLEIYQGVELLSHRVCMCSAFVASAEQFSNVLYQFLFL